MSKTWLAVASASFLAAACADRPPFVVLSVEDPSGAATGFSTLHLGFARDALEAVKIDVSALPLAVTVTAETASEKTLWVEARAADGNALARGAAQARFAKNGTPTATVRLAKACTLDGECNDGLFCSGTVQCQDEMCVTTGLPCVSNFPCVLTTCVELGGGEGTCNVTVDHAECADGAYCDPGAGCVEGPRCMPENNGADCQDGSVCNGIEVCNRFRCEAGDRPEVDDGDECTIDGCNDLQNPPVFHLALSSRDGNPCTIPGTGNPGTSGVCVSAKGGCVESECGDGVVDEGALEVCDDGPLNTSDWLLDQHCNPDCSGFGPFCGDNRVAAGHETCDDGARFDSGNGCSDQCQRNDGGCGDGVTQSLFEECDDQDADECDGCKSNCTQGCICAAPGACLGSNWCSEGECVACDVPSHCGPSCVTCSGTTPLCGSVTTGCVCDPSPGLGLRGSCGIGTYCGAGGACTACAVALHCGQDCLPCTGDTPVCGGVEVGCVVDPATDPPSRGCAGKPDFTPCRVASPTRSYNICIDGACREPGCGDETCNAHGPSFAQADVVTGWEYPDTNQRVCYNASTTITCTAFPCAADGSPAFCGQDAQYGWDTTHAPAERWTRTSSSEPMVTDNITGLVWQGCAAGLSGSACTAGLLSTRTWADALTYCDGLSWGGYSDWRLPDYHELQSIIDLGRTNPSIDVTAFPGTPASHFWSSSSCAGNANYAWDVFLGGGDVSCYDESGAGYARCVRPGPLAIGPLARFSRSEPAPVAAPGQFVTTDRKTKLMWQGCAAGQSGTLAACTGDGSSYSWQAAMTYCEGLTWGGFSDWRLPNLPELASIVDPGKDDPSIDGTAFPGTPTSWFANEFWSSSPAASSPYLAWVVYFADYYVEGTAKSGSSLVRCVRPGP